jgi:hypothetical protein
VQSTRQILHLLIIFVVLQTGLQTKKINTLNFYRGDAGPKPETRSGQLALSSAYSSTVGDKHLAAKRRGTPKNKVNAVVERLPYGLEV